MSFLSIMDIVSYNNNSDAQLEEYLNLRVIQDSGVETVPDMNLSITGLNKGADNKLYKQFFNGGDGGITFKVNILIKRDDAWNNRKVSDVLNEWYTTVTVLRVVTDAMDVPDGEYVISKNPNRVQTYDDSTKWELEFTTYRALNIYKYENDNSAVLKALQKANTIKKSSNKTKSAKSTYKQKLKKCDYKVLKYNQHKKVLNCVKFMQQILNKEGLLTKKQIDGWFGKVTKTAVKQFQKKYKKKYKLKVTGKVDKSTYKALCK